MGRVVLLMLAIAVLVAAVYVVALMAGRNPGRLERARRRVKVATDLAYAYDDLYPVLAGAIIQRTRGLGEDHLVQDLEDAVEDVLALARQHRDAEPELAVIVIDELRRDPADPR